MAGEKLDPFLLELQSECLIDAADNIGEMRALSESISKDLTDFFEKSQKILHNLKGNLQAVGFLEFGTLVHHLETAFQTVRSKSSGKSLGEADLQILRFFLYDIFEALDSYVEILRNAKIDSEQFRNEREHSVVLLESWGQSAEETQCPSVDSSTIPSQKSEAPAGENSSAVPFTGYEVAGGNVFAESQVGTGGAPQDQDVGELGAEFRGEAHVESKRVDGEPRLFLALGNSGRHFALPLECVIEVIRRPASTPLPIAHSRVQGVINLRGEAVPLVSFSDFLGEQNGLREDRTYCVIAKTGTRRYAFPVEEVSQVIALLPNGIYELSAQSALRDAGTVFKEYAIIEGRLVLLFDPSQVVAA